MGFDALNIPYLFTFFLYTSPFTVPDSIYLFKRLLRCGADARSCVPTRGNHRAQPRFTLLPFYFFTFTKGFAWQNRRREPDAQ